MKSIKLILSKIIGNDNTLSNNILFIDFTGSHEKAQFLSQLFYWSSRTKIKGGWIAKRHDEWFDEIRVKSHSIRRFAKDFNELGFLEKKMKKFNGVTIPHYKLDQDELIRQLVTFCEGNKLLGLQIVTPGVTNCQPSQGNKLSTSTNRDYTETTTETTILSDSERIVPFSPDQLNATGTGSPVKSSAAAAPNSAPAEDEFPFQAFWDAYDHKVGRAKSEKKWKRMTKKEKREAMRVVAWYVKDTVKDDSEQHGNVWRPRRQNPLTWLNGPGWEDYAGATGPRIKNQPAPTSPGSRFQAPRPTIPAGYARNEPLDINALPD